MIKVKVNNEYKDVVKIFCGGTIQKEIIKVWSREAQEYVYESSVEYTGSIPITINANGEALLDYRIYGNIEQTGTPTPENPIMPIGCGERTENLYNINTKDVTNGYINNAQLNQDGTTEVWGSAEVSEYIPISGDTTYTFNGIGSYNSPCYALYDENKQLIGAYTYNGASTIHFTSPSDARYFRFTHIKTASMAMLVEGSYTSSTMPEYEPYGYKLPMLSNSTVTNIYLGESQTTRRIKKLVLTGEENVSTDSYLRFLITISNIKSSITRAGRSYCSHYECLYHEEDFDINWNNIYYQSSIALIFHDKRFAAGADFKSYLAAQYAAGTPVTVWYVLAEPETGIVNEPLMKIGDYADMVSMEQAGVSIPTFTGTTVIDYDGAPKPSQMYVKYRR